MKVYEGLPAAVNPIVLVDGQPLDIEPSRRVRAYSPDGVSWGYRGAGPKQLALAVLLDHFGDASKALALHLRFTVRVVESWPQEAHWVFTGDAIDEVCAEMESQSETEFWEQWR